MSKEPNAEPNAVSNAESNAERPGSGSLVAARAARAPKTKHSESEFDARRLAPWRPVQEHSPTAYRPGNVARPCRSVAMPPIM